MDWNFQTIIVVVVLLAAAYEMDKAAKGVSRIEHKIDEFSKKEKTDHYDPL